MFHPKYIFHAASVFPPPLLNTYVIMFTVSYKREEKVFYLSWKPFLKDHPSLLPLKYTAEKRKTKEKERKTKRTTSAMGCDLRHFRITKEKEKKKKNKA